MKTVDIARALNVFQTVVSRFLKKHRETGSVKESTEALWYVVHFRTTTYCS